MAVDVAECPKWVEVKDGNLEGLELFRRHYSYNRRRDQGCFGFMWERNRNRNLYVGPGEKVVLVTADGRALFIWRKFKSDDGQTGVNCAAFHNEVPRSVVLASDLIREADAIARRRWPGERFYTYVNPRAVRPSRTPGRCFLKAGWRYVMDGKRRAVTKARGLLILERPADFPTVAVLTE